MTVINGLPVKNKMKNVFLENHVFTRFNLVMHYYKCYMLYVKKAYIFELSSMYVTHFINFFPNKSCFKPSNCNIVDFKKYTSPPLRKLEKYYFDSTFHSSVFQPFYLKQQITNSNISSTRETDK